MKELLTKELTEKLKWLSTQINEQKVGYNKFYIQKSTGRKILYGDKEYKTLSHIKDEDMDNKFRIIYSPNIHTKLCSKALNEILQTIPLPENVIGFRKGKSIADNKYFHLNCKRLLGIDLKDFFNQFKVRDIVKLFCKFNLNNQEALKIAKLITLNNHMVQGNPASPAVANLFAYQLDLELIKIADKHHLKYTRYADDINFSSMKYIKQEAINEIIGTIRRFGMIINRKKIDINSNRNKKLNGAIYERGKLPRCYQRVKKKLKWFLKLKRKHNILHTKRLNKLNEPISVKQMITGCIAFKIMLKQNKRTPHTKTNGTRSSTSSQHHEYNTKDDNKSNLMDKK